MFDVSCNMFFHCLAAVTCVKFLLLLFVCILDFHTNSLGSGLGVSIYTYLKFEMDFSIVFLFEFVSAVCVCKYISLMFGTVSVS